MPSSIRGKRVLCVDDNALQRQMLELDLTALGLRTTCVENAAEALLSLGEALDRSDPYALVVLDYLMPGVDGIELAEQLRGLPALMDAPFVLLSPIVDRDHRQRAARAGIAATLSKPVHQAMLQDRLCALLDGRSAESSPAPCAAPAVGPRSARILVVEDNAVNQHVITAMLAKLGLASDLAANGMEALAALERVRYDLVLMDCQMPEMDGYRATREIRRIELQLERRTPIVALTANALQGDRERCLEAGMDGFLTKPVRIEILKDVLTNFISARAAANG